MKTLVAGGAGFIGSHLVDLLLSTNHRVVCIDNFFIGTKQNIAHLQNNSNFTFYEENLCNLEALSSIFQKEQFEAVFHLAANSDIQASAKNPKIEYDNTYTTTFNIVECMRLHHVKKLFFASTSAVYGEQFGLEVAEDTVPLQPISYYGACKLGAENLIHAYSYMNDFHSLVFRFPNVIGPRLTHGVIYDFMKRLQDDPKNLTILGDGTQEKPYMYVTDLVDAIVKFYDVDQGVTIYNVGVNTQTSVTRIAEIVCKELGLKDVSFSYTGGKAGWKGDVPKFAYNLGKITKENWYPNYTSDQAVELTAQKELTLKS